MHIIYSIFAIIGLLILHNSCYMHIIVLFIQTAKEFHDNYTNAYNGTEYKQFAAAFDALWTVARVLNYTETLRNTNMSTYENCSDLPGELVPLNEFNYSNAFMGCVMSNSYYEVNFTGVSVSLL